MSITISFTPWQRFRARKNPETIRSWLREVGKAAEEAFRSGMGSYPPASSSGSYPSSRSGLLKSTIRSEAGATQVTIGTSAPYSGYLRSGTRKMARRKMSDNALKEGMAASQGRLKGWVEWVRG